MTAPVVSVIIPTYNRARLVERAIRSVLAQTFSDWELLVVDDGSTDNTEEVVRGFADQRIRYVRRENGGVSAARNLGLALARGTYVSLLDSDDEYHPSKLEMQVDVLKRGDPGVGAVECGFMVAKPDREFPRPPSLQGMTFEDLLAASTRVINVGSLMLKREVAASLRFDESFRGWEDVDFLLRLLKRCRIAFISEPLVVVHYHGALHLSTAAIRLSGLQQGFRKFSAELETMPKVRAKFYLRMGRLHARLGEIQEARREFLFSVRAWPWNAIAWLLFVASLLGDSGFPSLYRGYARMANVKSRLRGMWESRGGS